jgi:hypothetical protein
MPHTNCSHSQHNRVKEIPLHKHVPSATCICSNYISIGFDSFANSAIYPCSDIIFRLARKYRPLRPTLMKKYGGGRLFTAVHKGAIFLLNRLPFIVSLNCGGPCTTVTMILHQLDYPGFELQPSIWRHARCRVCIMDHMYHDMHARLGQYPNMESGSTEYKGRFLKEYRADSVHIAEFRARFTSLIVIY